MNAPIIESAIACPQCKRVFTETMPTDACLFFWHCPACGTRSKPKAGDCCVFCSYGTVKCPPVQADRGKGENGVGDLARNLVDHEIVNAPEMLAITAVDRCALDLVRGDQAGRLVDGHAFGVRIELQRSGCAQGALLVGGR